MRKTYEKPRVSKVEVRKGINPEEIDSDIIRMLSKQGFADLFWERLQEARKENTAITQESVFDMLNEKYLKVIGCTRYSCYDSFRIVRDKKQA